MMEGKYIERKRWWKDMKVCPLKINICLSKPRCYSHESSGTFIISVGGILKNIFIFFQKLNFWVILCIFMIEFRPRNLICVSSVGEIKKYIFSFFSKAEFSVHSGNFYDWVPSAELNLYKFRGWNSIFFSKTWIFAAFCALLRFLGNIF